MSVVCRHKAREAEAAVGADDILAGPISAWLLVTLVDVCQSKAPDPRPAHPGHRAAWAVRAWLDPAPLSCTSPCPGGWEVMAGKYPYVSLPFYRWEN